MVPDLTTGPYFAHYEQNWFYSENIALGVTADGLLSTVSGTSTDKTPQIISNLVDTGIDLAEFAAQVGSFTAAAAPGGGGTTMNYANQVRYKRLNIDVTFDPFDPDQVENVGKLFHTVVAVDPGVTVGGTTYLVSPFTFAVNTIRTPELATSEEKLGTGQGKVSKPNADGSFRLTPKIPARNQQGLWFREMTPVEILLKQNPEEFRVNAKAVLEFNESNLAQNSDDTLNPQTAASQLQKAQQKESDAKDNLTRLNAILTALTNGKITSPLPTPKDLTDANDAINKAQESVSTAHDDVIAKQANSNLATAIDNLRKAFAAAPTISRTARFVKSVPNPERVFAFNISRSAFVTNKITTLTISNGVLTQFALNKPSEAEGFSEIPLNIAQKLLQLPSSLLTIRTQRVQAQNSLVGAQTNLVNSQSQLLSADQQAQQNIGQLNAQAASVNAQTSLLQSQTNLLNQQQALKQAQAGH